jgi:hypothetical protein
LDDAEFDVLLMVRGGPVSIAASNWSTCPSVNAVAARNMQ